MMQTRSQKLKLSRLTVSLFGAAAIVMAQGSSRPASHAAVNTGTVIYGCLDVGGILCVVGKPNQCYSIETPIQWHKQGPTGLNGAQGPVGPMGPAGPVGLQGAAGGPILPHVLSVPAINEHFEENGRALMAALQTAAAGASQYSPYVVQLDAGIYQFSGSEPFDIPGFVSLKGAGSLSTTIQFVNDK